MALGKIYSLLVDFWGNRNLEIGLIGYFARTRGVLP